MKYLKYLPIIFLFLPFMVFAEENLTISSVEKVGVEARRLTP